MQQTGRHDSHVRPPPEDAALERPVAVGRRCLRSAAQLVKASYADSALKQHQCAGVFRRDIERARQQWQAFMAAAPAYPVGAFQGQGITILAGGGRYMVPAWVNMHMLRRTGPCSPLRHGLLAHSLQL